MARNGIKGIIVEIGGDTSGLQKALSKVDSATANLSKELKNVNSLLKLDPKNTELLSQKQTVLTEKIESTEEALKTLKNVQGQVVKQWEKYKQVEPQLNKIAESLDKEKKNLEKLKKEQEEATKAFEKGKISEEQYNKINEAVKECNNNIKALKKEQKELSEGTVPTENYRAYQREIATTEQELKKAKQELINFKNENSNWNKTGNYLTKASEELDIIGNKINSLGNKLTVGATVPIVASFTAMTNSAIETETAVQQVDRIYGKAAESIKKFAEEKAIDYNMSASEAYKYSQIYGNLIQSITDDQTENATKTQELLQASSVIASATGRSMEDVMDRIRSGLLGNTEAIEDLGVNVNVALLETTDAFKKIAGNKSWEKLTFQEQQQIRLLGILEQTSKKYGNEVQDNTASSIQKLTAKTKNLTSNLGKKLLPIANDILEKADDLIDSFGNLSDEQQQNIVKIGLMVAAAGPLLKIGGTAITTIGKASKGIGTFTQAIGVATGKITSTKDSVNNLAKVLQGLTSPAGLAAVGITAAVTVIVAQIKKAEEETKEKFSSMGQAATDFYEGIQNAEGYLDKFNNTLFASTEEQEKLQKEMDDIQAGITKICKTASDERRGYTQEEITQLDEYFNKLRELEQRELEIEQHRAEAISQSAKTESEAFQGTLEEYKQRSQEWILTAQQQADKQIEIAENNRINTIALLNSQYSEEDRLHNEEYQRKITQAEADYQAAVEAANKQVGAISSIYAQGYADRANQDGDFYEHMLHYNALWQEEEERHANRLQEIEDGNYDKWLGRTKSVGAEIDKNSVQRRKIMNEMYNSMSESEVQQLGSWLAMLANTEMYGGKITDEDKKIVDTIIETYDNMPKKTREAMKNAMSPMLEEMENKEPSLFAKASGIANGILSRLKQSFDIHSPSKETRGIFQNVMKGAELGLDDEEKSLNKQIEDIANKMKVNFSNMIPNMGAIKQSVIDQTRTIFTTPSIIINAQDELTPAKINSIINAVNRRLGSQY